MKLSISEAARRAGVRRNTLYRKLEAGKISKETDAEGKPVIDLAELCRLYPHAATAPGRQPQGQNGAGESSEVNALRELVTVLKNDKDRLTGELEQERKGRATDAEHSREERERMLSLLENAQKQIADMRKPEPPPAPAEHPEPPRRGFFARLLRA
jgi:hypothetical protein